MKIFQWKGRAIFQFSILASGSKGNAVYIESEQASLLIDIGLGPRVLKKRLEHIRREPQDVSALFLTHEHSDHISGAGALTKKHKTPVYGTRGTREAMRRHVSPDVDWRTIQQEDEATVGDLTVESFATPHDAAESCGLRDPLWIEKNWGILPISDGSPHASSKNYRNAIRC